MDKISIHDFFDLVVSGEMGRLDMLNYVQDITDNFKKDKLSHLLNDIEFCFFCEKEERNGSYSTEDIQNAIADFERRNMEIPVDIFEPMTNKKGETITNGGKLVNLQKLLYPYDYFSVYELIKIIKHHIELLNPETETQEPPQKFEKLKPFEKILIIHYLKIESLKRCILGQKPGVFFLSRLLDINPESIKKPLLKLDDYTTNELTESQARVIYPTLEKVKSFFDESELNEISKVIQIRINAIKRILGKD